MKMEEQLTVVKYTSEIAGNQNLQIYMIIIINAIFSMLMITI